MLTLVLLPGMDGTGDLFKPLLDCLDREINTVVVRYPDAPLDYRALIAHARLSLPDTGDFFLLGESFSGPVAVGLAAEDNPRLRGLLLSAAFIRNPLPWTAPFAPLSAVLPVSGGPAALMTRLVLGPFDTLVLRDMIGASLAQMSSATIRARLQAIATVDVTSELASVKVPILYLRAGRDRVVLQSSGALIGSIKPATQVVTVNAPHFLLQVAPQEAAREIGAFINKVITGGD